MNQNWANQIKGGVLIPHAPSPSPFLPYHPSLDHGGVVMSTSLQVTMTTAQGEALSSEVIASLGIEEGRGESEHRQKDLQTLKRHR